MREKFALQDTHKTEDTESHMYVAIVDCGMGPRVLRLCLHVNGSRFNDETLESEIYGPAQWTFEMMPSRRQGRGGVTKFRGSGDSGFAVTIEGAWEIIEGDGLPADYSFA